MATYAKAAQAKELIFNVAQLNNGALEQINRIISIRSKLVALTAQEQLEIEQAVADMGYDANEIKAMLTKWQQVANTVSAQALVKVEAP